MELNALIFYVKDVFKTAEFYEKLGFEKEILKDGMTEFKVGNFWLDFHDKNEEDRPKFRKDALKEPKGGGFYIYVEIHHVDDYYKTIIDEGLKPATWPENQPWGNREFMIADPDGYKIVFYQVIRNE